MERVQKDDTSAMIFYLKTQSRWKEPKDEDEIKDNKLEIVVKVKEHENLDKHTPEQIKQLKDKGSL